MSSSIFGGLFNGLNNQPSILGNAQTSILGNAQNAALQNANHGFYTTSSAGLSPQLRRGTEYAVESAAGHVAALRLLEHFDVEDMIMFYDLDTGKWRWCWRYGDFREAKIDVDPNCSMADCIKVVKAAVEMQRRA